MSVSTEKIIFDPAAFRAKFPAFKDYSDAQLSLYWDTATIFIKDVTNCALDAKALEYALQLMTAHLILLSEKDSGTGSGSSGVYGPVKEASIDKVSVSIVEPPAGTSWRWWMSLTPYGIQLLALLRIKGAGGFYVGGRPEGSAFRRVGGGFGY